MKTLQTIAFVLFVMTLNLFAQSPPLETGVSRNLAKWRAANYSDVRYKLNITLEKGAPLMKGNIEIHVNLTEEGAKNDLILDWRTRQFQNDKDKPYANVVAVNTALLLNSKETLYFVRDEHLIIDKSLLKTGENIIKINFASPIKTSGAAITRYVDKEDGGEYVYSLFVPSDASTAFPVFDQPDLKARFSLDITTPIEWKVISNTICITRYGENLHHFVETKPISTYVFAFAAGDFELFSDPSFLESLKKEPISFPDSRVSLTNIYVRKSQAEKFKAHAAEVFRLNREGIKFLENWFDYKFPFPKYDLVLIAEFPFGGMEHAGCTFLREDRIIFPTEPTKNDFITRANVIFHEAAHQWFGDTVTMKWFDDLWLKEGFAEFMAYKTLEKVMPEYNAWKIFYERNKQAAYLTDITRGTTPIYQEIPNLSAAKSAYGNIVYRKAPSFLRQAEFYLGEDKFQTAVRAFLKKHEFANAEWTDLVKEFETASKQDLKDWGNSWVTQKGTEVVNVLPNETSLFNNAMDFKIALTVMTAENGITKSAIFDQKATIDEKARWKQKIKLLRVLENGEKQEAVFSLNNDPNEGKPAIFSVVSPPANQEKSEIVITREQIEIWRKEAEEKRKQKVAYVFPNYQDYGYGIFLLDEKSRAYVLANIGAEKDDFLRSMMWGSLWDSVRFYELAPVDYVALVIKNINIETDESTIATLLNRVSTAMNYYLTDAQAKQFAPEIEKLLIDKMQNALTLGQRITFYRSFVALASTENARSVLKDILSGKLKIKDLDLKAKDKFDIVTKLITLNDADGLELLAALEKSETGDAAKRYAYAARAGVPTAENKARYWNDFVGNKDISESYIESAFNVFNTPRQDDLTLPYLEKALAELPNLKANRKIFFVNGWLGAFIGGQKSAQALQIVNKFLADNPNLDKDLRLKILENADNLERAVKIRAKYEK